jgi:hypothetical protein
VLAASGRGFHFTEGSPLHMSSPLLEGCATSPRARSASAAPYQQKDGGFTPYIFLLLMLHGMHVLLGGILPLELRRF